MLPAMDLDSHTLLIIGDPSHAAALVPNQEVKSYRNQATMKTKSDGGKEAY